MTQTQTQAPPAELHALSETILAKLSDLGWEPKTDEDRQELENLVQAVAEAESQHMELIHQFLQKNR